MCEECHGLHTCLASLTPREWTWIQASQLAVLCVLILAPCSALPWQSKLALDWRDWMTRRMMDDYFSNRTFYSLQAREQPTSRSTFQLT